MVLLTTYKFCVSVTTQRVTVMLLEPEITTVMRTLASVSVFLMHMVGRVANANRDTGISLSVAGVSAMATPTSVKTRVGAV